jgi:hypothetical protein
MFLAVITNHVSSIHIVDTLRARPAQAHEFNNRTCRCGSALQRVAVHVKYGKCKFLDPHRIKTPDTTKAKTAYVDYDIEVTKGA